MSSALRPERPPWCDHEVGRHEEDKSIVTSASAPPRPAVQSPLVLIRDLAFDGVKGAAVMLSRSLGVMPKLFVDGIRRPVGTATEMVSTVGSILRTMRPIAHPESPIMQERSRIRRLALAEGSKEKLRVAGAVVGGSRNDVFIAAIAGGAAATTTSTEPPSTISSCPCR